MRKVADTGLVIWLVSLGVCAGALASESVDRGAATQTLSLQACLDMAMECNHTRPASQLAVAAAEAQHRQALSGYWPKVTLQGAYEIMDEDKNYIFPSSTFGVPPQTLNVPGTTFNTPPMLVTIPAGAFGPGFPPATVQLPVASQPVAVPGQSYTVPGQAFAIPDQEITLHDEESWYASVNAQWLLWDGGMRKGFRQQSRAGVDAARANLRRADLAIIDEVTRYYYGAIMAGQVLRLGRDSLARMEATLGITESMYKEGAGRVTKADYLDNKIMVETLRSTVAVLEKNVAMAQAALAFSLGLSWRDTVVPAEDSIPYSPMHPSVDALVSDAFSFSPDWQRLEAGISAAEGELRGATSGYYPRLALTGDLHKWWNDHDKGYATDENKEGWTVRLGLEIPLFQGFITRNKVKEARARLEKIRSERVLMREGIGLQVRNILLEMDASEKCYEASMSAMKAAVENRDLNTRAYQNELVETADLIKSQLVEAFMSAQYYKVCFDHAALRSKLQRVVGGEIEQRLSGSE